MHHKNMHHKNCTFFENEAVFRFNKEEWRKSIDISGIKMKYFYSFFWKF